MNNSDRWLSGTEEGMACRLHLLPPERRDETRELYETVFSEDELSFVDDYYMHQAKRNRIYAAENSDGIQAMLHVNPVPVLWNGEKTELSYVVAVATRESYRRRGLMKALMEQFLADACRRQEPFVFLMPASEAIYTPFGFRTAWKYNWEEVVLRQEIFRKENDQETDIRDELCRGAGLLNVIAAEQCSDACLEKLAAHVNRAFAKRYELFVYRTKEYYRELSEQQAASGGRLDILFRDGEPCAAACQSKEKFPDMMARVTCLSSFIKQVRSCERKEFYLQITDHILQENNGLFQITLTPEGGTCFRRQTGDLFAAEAQRSVKYKKTDISELPTALGISDPFLYTMISEVV